MEKEQTLRSNPADPVDTEENENTRWAAGVSAALALCFRTIVPEEVCLVDAM